MRNPDNSYSLLGTYALTLVRENLVPKPVANMLRGKLQKGGVIPNASDHAVDSPYWTIEQEFHLCYLEDDCGLTFGDFAVVLQEEVIDHKHPLGTIQIVEPEPDYDPGVLVRVRGYPVEALGTTVGTGRQSYL